MKDIFDRLLYRIIENSTALALNGNVRNQNQKRGFDLFLLTSRFARASARLLYRIIASHYAVAHLVCVANYYSLCSVLLRVSLIVFAHSTQNPQKKTLG